MHEHEKINYIELPARDSGSQPKNSLPTYSAGLLKTMALNIPLLLIREWTVDFLNRN